MEQEKVTELPLATVVGWTMLMMPRTFMAGSRALASSMYAHVKDTEEPESRESKRNTRLMASSAKCLLLAENAVQFVLVQPSPGSSFLKP